MTTVAILIISIVLCTTLNVATIANLIYYRRFFKTISEHGTYYGKLGTFIIKVPEKKGT